MNREEEYEPIAAGDAESPAHREEKSKITLDILPEGTDGSPDISTGFGNAERRGYELPTIDNLSNADLTSSPGAVGVPATGEKGSPGRMSTPDKPHDTPGRGPGGSNGSSRPADMRPVYRDDIDSRDGSPNEAVELSSSPAAVSGHGGDNIDETDFLEIIRREWWLIAAIIAAAMIAGAGILSSLTPTFTASTEVIIEPQRQTLPALEAILPGVGTDEQSIVTEAEVLTSGTILNSVIDELALIGDPEFNSMLESSSAVPGRRTFASALEPASDRMRVVTRDALLSRLDVMQVGDTRVIAVFATSESPEKAARIANTLVDEYLRSRQEARFQATYETSTWLEGRIAELRGELRESEQRTERFRSDAELLEAGGTTLISQQLVDLNRQIISARAATAAAQAELTQVERLIESSDGSGILASAGILQSPLVQELRKQQVALERQVAELSSEFGPAHPRMVQLNADAADLRSQIAIEVDKVVQSLRSSVRVARAREAELERQSANLTARLGETKEDDIELRALEREAEANRQLLETLLARRKELGSPNQLDSGQPGARVISYAVAPVNPSFPRMGLSLAGIFIVSTIFALVVAFVREIRRQGITTLEQLEAVSGLNALGFVPHVTSRRQRRKMLESIVSDARVPFAQAMNTVNWQLDESMPEPAKVILVTSSVPGEGKTTTAIGIARVKALKGHKTIIVDGDLRNPTVATRLNCESTSGLRDVVQGKSPLEDAVVHDDASALAILPAGQASSDALGLVESSTMSSVLDQLGDEYDYVIVDSPPIATAPDACVLSRESDTTIFVVRWSKTPVNAVKYALRIMRRNGGHVIGSILTMVEPSRSLNRKYGYFGYYGYYGKEAQP